MPRIILTLFLIAILNAPLAIGQNKPSAADPQDPQGKDRKVKREPDRAFIDWLRDVSPIISKEEEDAFRKLRTNEERQRFIEMFWGARDPDPDTEENEYREEYYERVAYVNEHFSSGMPG